MGGIPTPNYRTGTMAVTCFSPAAHSLLPPCSEILSYIPEPDPYEVPAIIRDLQQTRRIFKVHFATGSRHGNARFILDSATEPHQQEPAPPVTSVPQLPPIPEMEGEGSSSSVPIPDAVTVILTETITPPPHTADPAEKKKETGTSASTEIRKQLFPEEQGGTSEPEAKKAKKE